MILAIDPGTTQSAYVEFDGAKVHSRGILDNPALLDWARAWPALNPLERYSVACEMVACYGMPVGKEVFQTCLIIGRLQEIFHARGMVFRLVFRQAVKIHLCHSARAKDGNVRQALIDRYGEPGTKKNQGALYGITSHLWSALAIADYAHRVPEPTDEPNAPCPSSTAPSAPSPMPG